MMRVPFETRDDQPHDGNPELRPGQIDGNGARDSGFVQSVQHPAQIFAQIVGGKARHVAKSHRGDFRDQCIDQRVTDRGIRVFFLVFGWRQIIANACDVSEPALRRLSQRSAQRDRAIGVAAGTVIAAQPRGIGRRRFA